MATVEFIREKAASGNQTFSPAPHGIHYVRPVLFAEAMVFALIPTFAATMARGYGSLSPYCSSQSCGRRMRITLPLPEKRREGANS